MKQNKKSYQQLAWLIAGGIFLFWGLQNFVLLKKAVGFILALFAPFLVGVAIAFVLNVPMRAIETRLFANKKHKKARTISLILTLLAVLAVLALAMFIILPELGQTFTTIRTGFPDFLERAKNWVDSLSEKLPIIAEQLKQISAQMNWKQVIDAVFAFLQSGATGVLSSTMNLVTSVFSGILNFFIGFIFAIYILFQKETLHRQFNRCIDAYLPKLKAERIKTIGSLIYKTFSSFLAGQCLEAVILGSLFFVLMSLFQFPYVMLISVLVALTALIPVFGAFIACFVGAFLILAVNPIQALWFIGLFLVLQQLEGNFIYPRVVGNSIGLPAMWVMMAVVIGGSTLGIVGMLIGVPLSSVIYALLRESVKKRLQKKTEKQLMEQPKEQMESLLKMKETNQ